MNIWLYLSAIIMLLTLLFTITRQFHMLQLNSYFNKRFFEYLVSAQTIKTIISIGVFCVSLTLIFLSPILLFLFSIISAAVRIYSSIMAYKNSKKRIVFTARIKRMYGTVMVLSVASLIVFALFLGNDLYISIYCFVICLTLMGSPFTAIFINIMNAPIEKGIAQAYVWDAKKILRGMGDMKIIGITGSYGKTSTKYILGRMLLEKYNVTITPESYNTLMGVVRTVRERLKRGTQIFVVEMGAKKANDIKEICDLVKPTMGVITSIGPQHLSTFKTVDNIVKTKFELADEVLKNNGLMFFNNDNAYIKERSKGITAKRYAIDNNLCDVFAENIHFSKLGQSFDICTKTRRISVTTKLLGTHNISNILAATAVCIELGLSDLEIKFAVSQLTPVAHRLEMKSFFKGSLLIDDAYNSNPEGSLSALKVLGSFDGMKRIIVTPGLVELGEKEYECNYNLGCACATHCDMIILVGEQRSIPIAEGVRAKKFSEENLFIVKTFQDALEKLRKICDKDTVVLFENDLPDNYAK